MNKNKQNGGSTSPEGQGLFDLLWQGLIGIPGLMRSLSFAIWVLIILAILTLAGTVLPQQHLSNDPVDFGLKYKALFDVDPSNGVNSFREFFYYNFVKRLELYNIFKTELYFVLILLLTISSLLCSWDRFFISRKLLSRTDPTIKPQSVLNLKYSGSDEMSDPPGAVSEIVRNGMKKSGFQVFEKECDDGRVCFSVRKNAFRHYASVAFHCALVFVLVGGIIGDDRMFAYEGTIAIKEGESRPIGSKAHAEFQTMQQSLPQSAMPPAFVPDYDERMELLDYYSIYRERDFVRIDPSTGFPAENYMSAPSDYVSHVKIIRPGGTEGSQVLADKVIQVNFPLRFGGIGYYQSSVNTLIKLSVTTADGRTFPVEGFQFTELPIPGFGFSPEVQNGDVVGGFWETRDGTRTPLPFVIRLIDYNSPMSPDPVLLGYLSEANPLVFDTPEGEVTVRLAGVDEYSIFSYKHDPGVPITYFGFLLLTAGITLTLYMPYRTGRIVVERKGNGSVFYYGSTWSGFPEFIKQAVKKLKK